MAAPEHTDRLDGPYGSITCEIEAALSPHEVEVVHEAVRTYLARASTRPAAWAVTGRGDSYGLGAAELRRQLPNPWRHVARHPFALREALERRGPGDDR